MSGLQLIVSALFDLGNVPQLEGVANYHYALGAVEEWQGGSDVALARLVYYEEIKEIWL